MSKEILLTVETFRDGEENKFLIKSAKEIQLILHAIAKHKSPVILYYADNEHFLKSLLLGVNEQGIWLDVGPNAEDNTALLNSSSITLVTMHHGAKVQLVCHSPVVTAYASHPAFFFPLPQQMVRLQRRDYFRISVSGDAALKCTIPRKETESENQAEVTIMDISLGGIALVCRETSVRLEEGEIYPDCHIELPDIGTLIATVQVKHLFDVGTPGGAVIKHAGCEFIQLDRNMSMMLQRYVALMQSKLTVVR